MGAQPVKWGLQYDAADSACTSGCFGHFYVGYCSTLDKQRICVNTQLKSSKKQLK